MTRSAAAALVLLSAVLVACSPGDETPPPTTDPAANVSLSVRTIARSDPLDEETRAQMEAEVADVLAGYVVNGFLGDYPREEFVSGFSDFTEKATELAVSDIAVLTASRFEHATSVRATELDARLSFLVRGPVVVGASAWFTFAFVVDEGDRETVMELHGRLALAHEDDGWSVFGYDVRRDDSDALPEEASS